MTVDLRDWTSDMWLLMDSENWYEKIGREECLEYIGYIIRSLACIGVARMLLCLRVQGLSLQILAL